MRPHSPSVFEVEDPGADDEEKRHRDAAAQKRADEEKRDMELILQEERMRAPASFTIPGRRGARAVMAAIVGTLVHMGAAGVSYFFNLITLVVSTFCVTSIAIAASDAGGIESMEIAVLGGSMLAMSVLSAFGIFGVCTERQKLLEMYAFGQIVLVCDQMAVIWVLFQNIGTTVADQLISYANLLCDESDATVANLTALNDKLSSQSWDGSIASNVQRNAGPAGPNFADRVCACHHRNMILMEAEAGLDRECWVRIIAEYTPTLEKLMVQVWILQFICAMLAYAFVRAIRREQNPPDEELQKPMEKWSGKDPPAILSVEAIMDPVAGVKAIYDFLNSIHWAAREEAHFLMASWYFETTVLFSSAANFFVLAYQSHALPPKVHMQSVLEIAEIFVTLLLTCEVVLDLGIKMTPAERRRIFKNPWLLMDIFVLAISWVYLFDKQRIFSLCRVLRVLRPLRTLRFFSEINTVLETMLEAWPLFMQAGMLVTFMLTAYSLTAMSLWSGGLSYQCSTAVTNSTDLNARKCPACIECPDAAQQCIQLETPPFVRSENFGFTGFDNFAQAMLTSASEFLGCYFFLCHYDFDCEPVTVG